MDQMPRHYAGFWIRAGTYFVDSVVVWLVSTVASLSLLWFSYRGMLPSLAAWWWKNIWTVPNILIGVIYFSLMTRRQGATLGKLAFGLRVVSLDGKPLRWGQVILRESVGKWISTLCLGLGFLQVAWSKKKQGWHDTMANTAVLITKPSLYEWGKPGVEA